MARGVHFSFPAFGHITPELAVVAQLVQRGEQVHVVTTERWHADVTAAGAVFQPYPEPREAFDPSVPTSGLFEDMQRLLALSEQMLPWTVDLLERLQPDYVLLDTKAVWGRLAAAIVGIPAITMSVVFAIRPDVVPVADLVTLLYGGASAATALEGLRRFTAYLSTARSIGARWRMSAPTLFEFLGNPQPLNIIFTSRMLQPAHDAFDESYRFVGASLVETRGATLPFPIEGASDPLVYVSLGTTFNDAPAFYEACFDAFGEAPWQTLISTGRGGNGLPSPPARVFVREFVPQLQVLERARVFVTHGGMNSVNEGLRAGVPLLVVPQLGDQFVVAQRVSELGAGVWIHPREATAARLRATVEELLSADRYRAAAANLGATLREAGGAPRAADEIVQFSRRAARSLHHPPA